MWAEYKEKELAGGATKGSILSLLSFHVFEKNEDYVNFSGIKAIISGIKPNWSAL